MVRIALICMIAALLAPPASAVGKSKKNQGMPGEKVTQRGRIDWEKGVLYATGLGAISRKDTNPAKAYLRARTFAKLDALRNLLMVVDHVKIDSRTTGADFENASDEIRAEVKGIVRGAQVVGERRIPINGGTMVEVTVATPMYGDQGIARVFVPEILRRQDAENAAVDREDRAAPPEIPARREEPPVIARVPEPAKAQIPGRDTLRRDELTPDIAPPSAEAPRYTALIVDARGMGLVRCMSPKLLRADGSEIWGTVRVNPDWVIEHGIVVYAHSIAQARQNGRAGDNPLVVRALRHGGGIFPSDPVLTDADAERVLAANARDGFLDRFRVIFVLDSGH